MIIRHTHILTIAGHECRGFLLSPLGYWVLFCFTLLLWYLYEGAMDRLLTMPRMSPYSLAPMAAFFHAKTIAVALLLTVPTITMRLIPEEKSQGTYELLLTYPIEEWHIVTGKFLGAWLYYGLLWLPSLFQVFLISRVGRLDWGQVVVTYFWLLICGAAFLSIGLAVSCLSTSQLAAFITAFTLLLPFTGYVFLEQPQSILGYLYIASHLKSACRGTLDSRSFFLFASLTAVSLFTASKIIEGRRWFPLSYPKGALRSSIIILSFPLAISTFIVLKWGVTWKTTLFLALLAMAFFRWAVMRYHECRDAPAVFAANVVVSTMAIMIIAIAGNYLSHRYYARLDYSTSRAFTLDHEAVMQIQRELPAGDHIEITVLFNLTERPDHEHLERDNERYFILEEVFHKLSDSLNRPGEQRISYQFIHPSDKRALDLQSRYGVKYRDVLLRYRDRYYIVSDAKMFEKKLETSDVPRLLVLWRKIYEAGGIMEPPPEDKETAYEKLKQKANPEMLAIYPAPDLEETLVNAILRLIRKGPRRVYFTQGAGEKWISGTESNEYSTARRLAAFLARHNFEVRPLRLNAVNSIPADCDLLVILGTDARIPFSERSLTILDDYLRNNGRLAVFLSAESDGGLEPLLNMYGIRTYACIATWHDFSEERVTVDLPLSSIASRELEDLVQTMREEESAPLLHMNRARIVEAVPAPDFEVTPILSIADPKVFVVPLDEYQQCCAPPYSLGAISCSRSLNGWRIAVVGNEIFASDSPSNYYYYLFGDPTPRPHILLGSNRFLIPALLEYLSQPLPLVPVKATHPIRFIPSSASESLRRYFWSNILLCLAVAIIGILIWRHERRNPCSGGWWEIRIPSDSL